VVEVLNVDPNGFLYRFVAGLAGLAMISIGVVPLLKGESYYTNWFGEPVLALLAVLFGVFTISFAIFKPDWLAGKAVERKQPRRF
jgi:hypothetical protein